MNRLTSTDLLAHLQSVVEKTTVNAKKDFVPQILNEKSKDSYEEILAKIEREQADFDAKMQEIDLTQYGMSMMDSFWAGKSKHQDTLLKLAIKEQRKANQTAIRKLSTQIIHLQEINAAGIKNGTIPPEKGIANQRQLNQALTSALMMSIMSSMPN